MAADRLDEMRTALRVADAIGMQLVMLGVAAVEMEQEQPGSTHPEEPLFADAHYEAYEHLLKNGLVMLHMLVSLPGTGMVGMHVYVRVADTEHPDVDMAITTEVLEALAEEQHIRLDRDFAGRVIGIMGADS